MADQRHVNVLGICGSLRAKSFNRMALNAAIELAPAGMTIEVADIAAIPFFNQDVLDAGMPAPVAAFRARIKAADALLIVSPEYNYSVSGVLKNAIDWASRPPDQPLNDKPFAVMGASPGIFGTARMQYAMRQIAIGVNMHPVNNPQVMIGQAASKFDAAGKLTDEPTRKLVGELLAALHKWTLRLQ